MEYFLYGRISNAEMMGIRELMFYKFESENIYSIINIV